MENKQIQTKKTEIITDIHCDICGKSCKVQDKVIDNELRVDNGEPYYSFNFMKLETYWGYYSNKDGQHWSAQLCESCVDTHLAPLIKFQRRNYNLITGDLH